MSRHLLKVNDVKPESISSKNEYSDVNDTCRIYVNSKMFIIKTDNKQGKYSASQKYELLKTVTLHKIILQVHKQKTYW